MGEFCVGGGMGAEGCGYGLGCGDDCEDSWKHSLEKMGGLIGGVWVPSVLVVHKTSSRIARSLLKW